MDPVIAPSSPDAHPALAPAGAVAAPSALEEQTAMLRELAQLCMEVTRVTARRVMAAEAAALEAAEAASLPPAYVAPPYPAEPSVPVDAALGGVGGFGAGAYRPGEAHLAFHRATRALQRSIALWRRLEREKDLDIAVSAQAALNARKAEAEARRLRAGRLIERVAHDFYADILPGEAHDAEAARAVRDICREAAERLGDDSLYPDLAEAPFSEIVARICRDVGIKPDWRSLYNEPWAEAEADAALATGGPIGEDLAAMAAREAPRRDDPARKILLKAQRPRLASPRWRRRHADADEAAGAPASPAPARGIKISFVDGKGNCIDDYSDWLAMRAAERAAETAGAGPPEPPEPPPPPPERLRIPPNW